MPLFNCWVDFVIQFFHPGDIWTLEERLNTLQAVDPRSPSYEVGMKAIIFEHDVLSFRDDELEVMEVTDTGRVTIWTKDRVWFVDHDEKLRFVPRHPPKSEKLVA